MLVTEAPWRPWDVKHRHGRYYPRHDGIKFGMEGAVSPMEGDKGGTKAKEKAGSYLSSHEEVGPRNDGFWIWAVCPVLMACKMINPQGLGKGAVRDLIGIGVNYSLCKISAGLDCAALRV